MLSVAKHPYQPCTSQPPRKLWLAARQKEILRSAQNDRLSGVAAAAQGGGGERFDGLQTAWTNVYGSHKGCPYYANAAPEKGHAQSNKVIPSISTPPGMRAAGATLAGRPRSHGPRPYGSSCERLTMRPLRQGLVQTSWK